MPAPTIILSGAPFAGAEPGHSTSKFQAQALGLFRVTVIMTPKNALMCKQNWHSQPAMLFKSNPAVSGAIASEVG
jgi:hypothetical protein